MAAASPLPPCGVHGVRLILPLGALPPFEFTTGVFVNTATSASLRQFFSSDTIMDPTAALCLDAPGMGKTTTVERAADAAGAVYLRFSAMGIVSSALHQTRVLLDAAAVNGGGLVEGATAEGIGLRVWKLALVACMARCRDGLATRRRMLRLCDGNGVDFEVPSADVQKNFEGARDALLRAVEAGACDGGDWLKNAVVVLHFDEIQRVLPELQSRICDRRPPAPATPADCMQYSLVWLSSAMFEMCVGGRIRPCMTGIGVSAAFSLRLDSAIKLWPLEPLPYFSARYVKQVLAAFVQFDEAADLDTVVCGVSGCPRAVQHLLLVIRLRAEALMRGEVLSPISCIQLVPIAYNSWRRSGVSLFLRGHAEHLRAAEEAFLCVCNPAAWEANAETADDDVPVATLPAASVKQSWRDAAFEGVLRLRISGEVATLFPPYPFLERYIRSLGPQRLAMCDCIELVQRARRFPIASGAMGRGKAFEFAVALELCLAGNVLLRAMLQCEQLHALGLSPLSKDVMPLRTFDSPSIEAVRQEVLIVSDGSAHVKPGDVAVPVIDPRSGPAWLVVEVKSSTADDPSYVRDGQVSFVEKTTTGFLQRFNLSCYLPTLDTQSQSTRPVKADVALAEYNKSTAAGDRQRYMGLVILDEALLATCTLNLASVLRCEEHTERTEAEWYKLIFSDEPTRALISAELHTRASAVCGGTAPVAVVIDGAGAGELPRAQADSDSSSVDPASEIIRLRRQLVELQCDALKREQASALEIAALRAQLSRV